VTQELLQNLNIPLTCKIGKKLFKKQFTENFSLSNSDKKILTNDIESITLEYLLNKNTINIAPYTDEEQEYSEIAFIKVEILNPNKLGQIVNIVQNIPYPLIIFLACGTKLCINISPKRINKSDSTKLVVEESHFSQWIDLQNRTKIEDEFLESLKVQNHPFTDFLSFYRSYLDKLIAFNASRYSGSLIPHANTKEILQSIQSVEAKIAEVKSKIKKETSFSAKVNTNIELKKLSDELEKLKGSL